MTARLRMVCLWISQVARVTADNCLRMFVVLELAHGGAVERDTAWHQATAVFYLPFILLTPINGMLGNALPKRWVLVCSAAFCLTAILVFGAVHGSWLACLGVVAVGAAVYSPARYALLPAIAVDASLPLTRVNGIIEMGGAGAVVVGLMLGGWLHEWTEPILWLSPAIAMAALLNGLAALASAPVWFTSDVRREESPLQAVRGFFGDLRRVLGIRAARGSLLGQALFLAVIWAGAGALLAQSLDPTAGGSLATVLSGLIAMSVGVAAGSLLAGLQRQLYRALGLAPWAATGLLMAFSWAVVSNQPAWPCFFLGLMGGLINVPLRALYQSAVPADARGNAMAILNAAGYLVMTLAAALLYGLTRRCGVTAIGQIGIVAGVAAVGAAVAWRFLLREAFEVAGEVVLWPLYRVVGVGPGVDHWPADGPVLIVGNHACWFDPLFLGKILPRPITPLMTSVFYDKPILSWLMRRVVRAIRVEYSTYRREAPEIQEAVAALDRGECVVIFPEALLRRTEARPLRQFGRGVWQILSARPGTPVIVCWIEGNWGSFTSYFHGPPTKNKRLDWRRPITIGLSEPTILPPELLADQRATRSHLMQACLASRKHLGLEPLELPRVASGKEDKDEEEGD